MRAGMGAGMEFLLLLEWSSRHSEGAIGMYNSAYLFGLFSSRFLAREVVLIYMRSPSSAQLLPIPIGRTRATDRHCAVAAVVASGVACLGTVRRRHR